MSDEDFVVPDDLSSLFAPASEDPSVALVVTPVAAPEPLAAACVLAGVAVDVVPSTSGAIAVLREPAAATHGAAAISKLLRSTPVVLLERREGNVRAVRVDPSDPKHILAASDRAGLFQSEDGGYRWFPLESPITDCEIWTLTIFQLPPRRT